MANEKRNSNKIEINKKNISGGIVYAYDSHYYVPLRDYSGKMECFQNKDEAIAFSKKQGWEDNSIVECNNMDALTTECAADLVADMYLLSLNDN